MHCPVCHTMIDPEEGCPRCAAPGRRTTFLATLGGLCGGALLLVVGVYLVFVTITAPTPFTGTWDDSRFTLASEDGSHRYTYEPVGGRRTVEGVAYFRNELSGIESFGVSLVVHYLSPEEHREVQRKFGDAGRCPASYYNQHMNQLEMIPRSDEEAARLQAFRFEQYTPFRAEGTDLRFVTGERHGTTIRLRGGSARAHRFLPDSYEIAGERLTLGE